MNLVELDSTAQTVRFLHSGVMLNPGSMGKGWALDRAGEQLASGTAAALLHGGRSSILALGAPPGQPEGWRVGLSDPADPTRRLGTLCLRDQAMSTSAATFRHGLRHGRRFGHLLDPRTGLPATGLLAATAFAPTAAVADALATAFFVLGEEETVSLCQARSDLGAILIVKDARRLLLLGSARQAGFVPTAS
jgi:thiamine biosynthesis lipoprotein